MQAALALATTLAGAVAAIGMLASFHTVSSEMRPSFHGWAWSVPVTLDMTVASFSLLELAMLRMTLPHLLARLTVYAATGASVYLNTQGATATGDHAELVAHAAMPVVWILYIELLRTGAMTLTRREHAATEHPVLALLLAPTTRLQTWRHGIITPAIPPNHQEATRPKMSASRGHFHGSGQHEDPMREGPDIFRTPPPDNAEQDHPATTEHAAPAQAQQHAFTPPDRFVSRPPRIGKGRGLTGRHAVLDLAGRHPQMTTGQIAACLDLSARTVRRHLRCR